jgi:hypothetical protein
MRFRNKEPWMMARPDVTIFTDNTDFSTRTGSEFSIFGVAWQCRILN